MRSSRILVVEDEVIVAMDIKNRLCLLGYEVAGLVSSGEAALALIEETRPDLILMDVQLSGQLDGIQAANQINERFRLPIVFLSAYSEDATVQRAGVANASGYIFKPFEDRELKTAIEMALYKHAAREEIHRLSRLYATLSEVNQAIVRVQSREEMLRQVCELAVKFGGFQMAWVGWLDPQTRTIHSVASFGDHEHYLDEVFVNAEDGPNGQGPTGTAIRIGKPVIANDFLNDTRTTPWHEIASRRPYRASAAFPIRVNGTPCGALCVYADQKDFFQEKEVKLLEETAMDVSFALDKLEEEARRKRAEQALAESSRFHQQIMASARDGIFVCDLKLKCQVWNPAMESLTGIPAAQMLNQHPGDVFPRLHKVGVIPQLESVAAGQTTSALDFSYNLNQTGRARWCSQSSVPLRDDSGNVVGVISTVRDITDRKNMESEIQRSDERLRESEDRYRRLVELSPDTVIIHCRNLVAYINPAGLKLFGATTPDQILNRPVTDFIHPDFRGNTVRRYKILFEEGKATAPMEEEKCLRLDGSSVDVEVSASAFRFGNEPAVLVMARDITSRKMMEARFLRNQRIETIGALASGIAHDLNNVLAPIVMTVALLRDKCEDPDTLALISAMETSAHRGAGIIQQLLTFGRGATGQQLHVHPKHLLKEIAEIAQETFPKSIKITTELRNPNWLVLGDATQLHQVLLNLCINARDAMPSGGNLTLFLDLVQIDEANALKTGDGKPGPYVVFGIQDTGKGIPLEIREKIFEPFFTTKEIGKGTGLGLATCLNLVKRHGGFIDLISEPGNGALFKVLLPAVPVTALSADCSAARPPDCPIAKGELILVVDDEESIRKIIRVALEKTGYRVLTANDGADAVTVFHQHHYEIAAVLIDVMMPVMGGPAAMRAMRAVDPKVLLIATSGMIPRELEQELAELKPRSFLTKPFTTRELLESLAAALADHKQAGRAGL